MERFILLINREKFDYTKWRKDLFEDMDIADLSEKDVLVKSNRTLSLENFHS